jgi:tetratricopeptide (TPR) repeat protein
MWELTIVSLVGVVALALATGGGAERGRSVFPRRSPALRALPVVTAAVALAVIAAQGVSLLTTVSLDDSRKAAARGDLTAALRSAEAGAKIQPWAATPYVQRALIEERALSFRRAQTSIAAAIDRDPDNWRWWLVRARIETEEGDVAAATQSLRHAVALNPRSQLFSDLERRGGS